MWHFETLFFQNAPPPPSPPGKTHRPQGVFRHQKAKAKGLELVASKGAEDEGVALAQDTNHITLGHLHRAEVGASPRAAGSGLGK